MNIVLFVTILFALQALYWVVGRYASNPAAGQEDYFLAGKSVQLIPLMMTFLATVVGGGIVLGSAEEAYRFGWPVLLYPIGSALGLMALGTGVGRRLAAYDVTTIAQLFEKVYGSIALRKIASALSIISLFMILVGQIVGSRKFLVSLNFDQPWLFALLWVMVIAYTAQGGLRAVISTDIVQALFFCCIFLLCFGYIFLTQPGALQVSSMTSEGTMDVSSKLCGWFVMPLVWMVIGQEMGQRCFAAVSPRIVSRASWLAGVACLIVCSIPVYLGCMARTMHLSIPEGSSVLMTTVIALTGPWLAALVGCAVIAAIVSTATSLINAISANLSHDFMPQLIKRESGMTLVRRVTTIVSLAAIGFAFYFDNIVDLLIQSYELSIACLFVPLMMLLVGRRGNVSSAFLSVAFGAAGFVLVRIISFGFPGELISMALSFAGYGVGEYLSSKTQAIQGEV